MSDHGWVTVENETDIARLPEDVFDYLTDITNEVALNDEAHREAHPGPDRPPHAIYAEWIKGNPTIVEYVRFERPTAWASVARSRSLDARGEGRISPTVRASRLVIRTELRPKGMLALLLPLMRQTMHKREERNLEAVGHLGAQQVMTGVRARALAPFVGADPRFAV